MSSPGTRQHLVRLLADGRFRSGQDLAARLGISRAAVWKQLRSFPDALGLEVDSVRGRGYRLRQPLELLDPERIHDSIEPSARPRQIVVHDSIDSTNSWLLAQARNGMPGAMVCLAERQEAYVVVRFQKPERKLIVLLAVKALERRLILPTKGGMPWNEE